MEAGFAFYILRISCEEPEERLKHVEDIVGDSISEQDCRRLLQSMAFYRLNLALL